MPGTIVPNFILIRFKTTESSDFIKRVATTTTTTTAAATTTTTTTTTR